MSQAIVRESRQKVGFLTIGLGVSLVIHGLFFQSWFHLNKIPFRPDYGSSILVPVITPPKDPPKEPAPKPEEKPPVKKKEPEKVPVLKIDAKKINPLPISHHRKEKAEPIQSEPVKPVFGVTDQTVTDNSTVGIGVRTGNTLFKEQEKEVTPKEQVKPYTTIPVFDLTTLPVFKNRETPHYPLRLQKEEIEGEVLLSITINEKGVVVDVTVKKSDNDLFSKAAVSAMFKSTFEPGLLNGTPVTTQIDIPVKFLLED